MSLIGDWWRAQTTTDAPTESRTDLSLSDWLGYFSYGGLDYPYIIGSPNVQTETIGGDYRGFIEGAFKANPVVFACISLRRRIFSDGRFAFRELVDGRPGDYFETPALRRLETPWPGGSTSDLLSQALVDADLAGNAYFLRRPGGATRLRPDWVTIVLGSAMDDENPAIMPDAEVVGYLYHPGGKSGGEDPIPYGPMDIAHFMPEPDPSVMFYRGISWLVPVVRELTADQAATTHKLQFFQSGGTKRTVISVDAANNQEQLNEWVDAFTDKFSGPENAYKLMLLAGGTDAKVIGTDMKEIDFKALSAQSENRICEAAGVPPILIGASEGLEAATYSNYSQARRAFADATMRPLWRSMCSAMEDIVEMPRNKPPNNSQLWIDDRDIAFLAQDMIDKAEVQQKQAVAMRTLFDAGWEPDSIVEAIGAADFSRLDHTGQTSVQNVGTPAMPPPANGADPAQNGDGEPVPAEASDG